MVIDSFGKLFTQGGEIVAEGSCQIDMERGTVTLRPLVDTPLISREKEPMQLRLDDANEVIGHLRRAHRPRVEREVHQRHGVAGLRIDDRVIGFLGQHVPLARHRAQWHQLVVAPLRP